MIYEAPSTPESLARYLATYITDDTAIAAHVKHRFGVEFDGRDIQRFRSSLPKHKARGAGYKSKKEPLGEIAVGTSYRPMKGVDDPLLRALASYHYKRSKTAEERRHWWRLM